MAGDRPGRVLRWMFRVPLILQRVGLGGWERLMGIRFIKITTKGRRTGKPHSVLVDILEHNEENEVYYVQSAYGERADWMRNIKANLVFEAQVGRRRFQARMEQVPASQAADLLMNYFKGHSRYTKTMMRAIGIDLDEFTEDELWAKLSEEVVLAIMVERL